MRKARQAIRSAWALLKDYSDPDGACNRAYYAVYAAVKAALGTVGAPEARTHKGTHSLFARHFPAFAEQGEMAGKVIQATQLARLQADYEEGFVPMREAEQAVRSAQAFVSAIEREFFPAEHAASKDPEP